MKETDLQVSAGGRKLKAMWGQWALLEARESLLYRRYLPYNATGDQNDDSKLVLQLVAPKSLRNAILQHLHNHKTGGNIGLTKTLYNVRQRFYWPGKRSDVGRWCHRCQECGARKPKKDKRAPLKQEAVGLPMERIALAIMGPCHSPTRIILTSWSLAISLTSILKLMPCQTIRLKW